MAAQEYYMGTQAATVPTTIFKPLWQCSRIRKHATPKLLSISPAAAASSRLPSPTPTVISREIITSHDSALPPDTTVRIPSLSTLHDATTPPTTTAKQPPSWRPHATHKKPLPTPARVHFADYDSDASTSLGSISSSDEATASPPPRRYRHRSHSRPERAHTPDAYDTNNRSYDRDDRHRRHKHSEKDKDKSHSGAHKTRDTFLGAGAGTIIGDAIFPGLGTAAGLVLGGYGGRKYARERSRSDVGGKDRDRGRDRERKGNRRVGVDGWDDKTKTFKKGGAVR
ncbi:hypothetical protein PTNB73_08382 [Pyrenophora teres f. teres]|nr:hypothetical protein PTNB73_08382 [Pyrenophora teres f. teres]